MKINSKKDFEIEMILGIDWGEKRIGLSLGENLNKVAVPIETVANLSEVLKVIIKEEISLIVLGNPLKMSGADADNPLFLNFFNKLKKESRIPIVLFDERLSTKSFFSLLGDKKNKAAKDSVSAMIILQSYFEKYG